MKLLAILSVFASFGAFAQDFTITEKMKSRPTYINHLSVKKVSEKIQNSKNQYVGSNISFVINGEYNADWCEIDYLSVHTTILPEKETGADKSERYRLQIFGVNSFTKEDGSPKSIRISDQGCIYGSEGKFRLPVTVQIHMGNDRIKAYDWTYIIPTGFDLGGEKKKNNYLRVRFEKGQGWTYRFEK